MSDAQPLRCVEMNCGAYADHRDDGLCEWHDANRLSQPIKPTTTPEQPVTPYPLPRPIRRHRKDWLRPVKVKDLMPRPIRRQHQKDWLELLVTWAIVLTSIYLLAQGVRLFIG